MTPFKANMIFAICVYLLGADLLEASASREPDDNLVLAIASFLAPLIGYGCMLFSCAVVFWTGIGKVSGKVK